MRSVEGVCFLYRVCVPVRVNPDACSCFVYAAPWLASKDVINPYTTVTP